MILNISKRKWSIAAGIAIITALIPIVLTVFELITTDKESVIFLENYPTPISVLILAYYALLMLWGVVWFIKQIILFFKLKNENAKAELLHLKSQVNPHFFFNTLNNLYSLVEKDPKKARSLILKLSDMMRYSIYEGEKEEVTLDDEIEYLKNYIELHKMRYHKPIAIEFDCQVDGHYKVMPLLFIILLENAFKHGVEKLREDAYVHLNLSTIGQEIHFEIENNFDSDEAVMNTGIGLKNLKRRLELVYPHQHSLLISESANVYKATLILQQL